MAFQLGTSVPAFAQSDESRRIQGGADADASIGLEEIVVTATRRAELLMEVPLSVTAYSQETLDQKGARNIDQIVQLTPGIQLDRVARYNGTASNVTVRGVRSTSGLPTTGIYIDDTPVQMRQGTSQSATNPYPRLFDLQRIEVLRGPQGTLFGAGAMGGALRFITPSPSMSGLETYLRSELAATDNGGASRELGAAVGAPIVENRIGMRLSAYYRKDGGFVDRVDYDGTTVDNDSNWNDAVALRGALQFQPLDALTIVPSVFYQKTRVGDTSAFVEALSDPDRHEFRQNNPLAQAGSDEFILPGLKIELDVGPATLISNTSYMDREVTNDYDATTLDLASLGRVLGPPPPALQHVYARSIANSDTRMLTQELRIQNNNAEGRLNWVVGAFYQYTKIHDQFSVENPFLLEVVNYGRANAVPPLPACATVAACFFGVGLYEDRFALVIDSHLKDKQIAAFAQVDYNISDEIKVTLGARYGDLNFTSNGFSAGPVIVSAGRITIIDQGSKPFTPKLGLSWQVDDDNLFYANIAKGFRVGTVAPPVGSRCAADAAAMGFDPTVSRIIEPDSLWSYEIGSKNRLFGGALVLDAAAYYIDWKNIQTNLTLPSCQIPTTINASDAVSKGVDLAVASNPVAGLSLGAMASFNDSHYTSETPSSIPGVPVYVKGEPLGGPPWSFNINAEYEFHRDRYRPYMRADLSHATHDDTPRAVSVINNPDIPRAPKITTLNLRAGVRVHGLDVAFFASNLLNDQPEIARYEDSPAANYFRGLTLRPRTLGVTVAFRN
jgi:outer membrane receptor protein involved in Fe transport